MLKHPALLVVPLLAACHVQGKNPADGDDKVMIDANDRGKVSFDMPLAKGEVQLPKAMMRGGDIDIDGVKLMPGSKLTGFSVMAGDEASNVNIAFSAPSSPSEVRAYYIREFARQGAKGVVEGDRFNATTRDGDKVNIDVSPDGAGSKGMIVIQDKE